MSFHSFNKSRGFTLTEFIVVIGIATLILGTVIGGQSRYTDLASLKSVATDLSLNLRQAQVYGVSVKGSGNGQTDFTSPYGIYLDAVNSKNKYIYYFDKNGNGYFDGNYDCTSDPQLECNQLVQIPRGNTVDTMCIQYTDATPESCTLGRVDVTFMRPSTQARFSLWNTSYVSLGTVANFKGVKINFKSPANNRKTVTIFKTGQISVQ